jgi:hypothetical protein
MQPYTAHAAPRSPLDKLHHLYIDLLGLTGGELCVQMFLGLVLGLGGPPFI